MVGSFILRCSVLSVGRLNDFRSALSSHWEVTGTVWWANTSTLTVRESERTPFLGLSHDAFFIFIAANESEERVLLRKKLAGALFAMWYVFMVTTTQKHQQQPFLGAPTVSAEWVCCVSSLSPYLFFSPIDQPRGVSLVVGKRLHNRSGTDCKLRLRSSPQLPVATSSFLTLCVCSLHNLRLIMLKRGWPLFK